GGVCRSLRLFTLARPARPPLLPFTTLFRSIGVVMLVYLDQAFERRRAEGRLRNRSELLDAVREGAAERVRPVLMTATAVTAGLRSEEHTSELQSREKLVCRLLLEDKK